MDDLIKVLPQFKKSALSYKFKTWTDVCAGWIEDVKSEA
jgi:hypothetical protein